MGACAVTPHMDADLTCRENLVLVGLMCGLPRLVARPRANALLVTHDLDDATNGALENLTDDQADRLRAAADAVNEYAGDYHGSHAEQVA